MEALVAETVNRRHHEAVIAAGKNKIRLTATTLLFALLLSSCTESKEKQTETDTTESKSEGPSPTEKTAEQKKEGPNTAEKKEPIVPAPIPVPDKKAEATGDKEPEEEKVGEKEKSENVQSGEKPVESKLPAKTEKTPSKAKSETKEAPKKKAVTKKPSLDAKPIYLAKCKKCHGITGASETGMGKKYDIPKLKGSKMSRSKVLKIIHQGVPDTKMKGFASKLSAEEIEALASYVAKM